MDPLVIVLIIVGAVFLATSIVDHYNRQRHLEALKRHTAALQRQTAILQDATAAAAEPST